MKQLILYVFLLSTLNINGQNFDVRNVNWGMTIQEVVKSEYPLKGEIEGNELRINNVDIGNGLTAKLLYEFSNGRLIQLKYIVYGNPSLRGTCENIIPLTDKVRYTTFIIEALLKKGYKCDMGWYLPNVTSLAQETNKKEDFLNCNLDYKTIKFVDELAIKREALRVAIGFESNRSYASFYYNEYHNNASKYDSNFFPCNGDYYNTLLWLEITPNYKVKEEMKKNTF
ncbi:MAG: hypothetical protein ACOVOQ_15235 [Flavobacterium sp.]